VVGEDHRLAGADGRSLRHGVPGEGGFRGLREVGRQRRVGERGQRLAPEEGIREVAADLGFSPSDFVTESYVGLFFEGGGQGDMVFPE